MANPRGRPFQPGNKAGRGRPRGSRNKSTAEARELFAENGADVIRKCLRMAKQGDPTAMRLCMERIVPARKSPPVRFKVPQIGSIADLAGALNSVIQQTAKGRITPGEGEQILALVDYCRRVLETEERLRPKTKPTHHGLSSMSDQELKAKIQEVEAEIARLRLESPTIEASQTDTDSATNTALPSKVAPPKLPAEVGNHPAGATKSDATVVQGDWKKLLPKRDWRNS